MRVHKLGCQRNGDVADVSKPLSHKGLLCRYPKEDRPWTP